ncbi:MAG TPA: aminoglycoside phosphotransferase family protein [Chloroflexia bacterium]|nr:aminoglycoside phosphotransferase family protein [Chloroflexia bacterium]
MLTQRAVAAYLLERGLVEPKAVVEGDLVVLDASRRNANFQVISEHGPSYLVKQGVGEQREATIANEAAAYEFLLQSGPSTFRRFLPARHLYSSQEHVLVLALLRPARTLQQYHARTGRFPLWLAAEMAEVLAAVHSFDADSVAAHSPARIEPFAVKPAPWVLSLHQPSMEIYHQISNANLQIVSVLQSSGGGAMLDRLRAGWQPRALVHYDFKGENVLVLGPGAGAAEGSRLKIVDWEAAGLGDPCWDVGSLFGEYLGTWLASIPVVAGGTPDQFLELAAYPLPRIQSALRGFWQAYARRMDMAGETAAQFLVRSTEYAAARLLQTAFEQSQGAIQVTRNTLGLVQLSFNILQRPLEAVVHLLGISLKDIMVPHAR